jgi:protease-4
MNPDQTPEPSAPRAEPSFTQTQTNAAPTPGAANAAKSVNWERDVLERLAFGALKEQRTSRRWGIFFKLVTLVYVTLLLGAFFAYEAESGREPTTDHTALISIDGVIDAEGSASAEKVISALDDAFDEPRAKGVILRINSPGGSPVQAGMIADEIKRLRARDPSKPIHVVVEDICASGGYYIAAAADRIYVDKASLVGSIGVIMDSFGVTELMNKIGVERRAYTSGENKAFLDPFQPVNENQRKHLQAMLDQIHQQFIDVVRQGRGKRLKETPDMFSGLVWNGAQAVDLGLADGMGTVDSVARDVLKFEDVVDYTVQESTLERLSKRISSEAGEAISRAVARTAANQTPKLH